MSSVDETVITFARSLWSTIGTMEAFKFSDWCRSALDLFCCSLARWSPAWRFIWSWDTLLKQPLSRIFCEISVKNTASTSRARMILVKKKKLKLCFKCNFKCKFEILRMYFVSVCVCVCVHCNRNILESHKKHFQQCMPDMPTIEKDLWKVNKPTERRKWKE